MKIKVSYISKWVSNLTHFSQYVEVWFSDKEFFEFKKQCYLYLKSNYSGIHEAQTSKHDFLF